MAQREEPTIILLDVHMPAGGGLQVLQRLRTNPKTEAIPILIITVDDSVEVRDKALALGAKGYLLKPIEPATLLEAVRPYLA